MSYVSIVARLEDVQPIPGADRIVSATASGYRLVVGADRKAGDLGVVFPAEGVLDVDFALHAGLLREHPVTGEKLDGYLDSKAPRIKCLTMRGVRTEALWVALDDFLRAVEAVIYALDATFDLSPEMFPDGYEFADGLVPGGPNSPCQISGYVVARKYLPPAATQREPRIKTPRDSSPDERRRREYARAVRESMPEHYDTPPAHRAVHSFSYGATVWATEKLHGESGMTAKRRLRLTRLQRAANFFAGLLGRRPYSDTEVVGGTRRTVLSAERRPHCRQPDRDDPHGAQVGVQRNYRLDIRDHFGPRLHPGEVVYFEVVGYTDSGRPIQLHRPSPDKGAESKALRDRWGAEIPYKYGCHPRGRQVGESLDALVELAVLPLRQQTPRCRVFAYRVTQDGKELPFEEMRRRAVEIGFEVPSLLGSWRHLASGNSLVDVDAELGTDPNDTAGLDGAERRARHEAACQRAATRETLRRARELAEGTTGTGITASSLDVDTPCEGVVLRVDAGAYVGTAHQVAKFKAHGFGVLEGYAKDRGELDAEEQDDADAATGP